MICGALNVCLDEERHVAKRNRKRFTAEKEQAQSSHNTENLFREGQDGLRDSEGEGDGA